MVNAIDTCRIFEDLFNFWDEKGEGWYFLGWIHILRDGQSTAAIEGTLELLLWLIEGSRPDIEAKYHTGRICKVLHAAHSGLTEAMSLFLELGPHGIIEKLKKTLCEAQNRGNETIFFSLITTRSWDQVKILHAYGTHPHGIRCDDGYRPNTDSPIPVYSPWLFWKFRNALRAMDIDDQDITREDLEHGCPLLDAGWHMETMDALFRPGSEPDMQLRDPYKGMTLCRSCKHFIHGLTVHRYWHLLLESIKNRTHPRNLGCNSQINQSSSIQSHRKIPNGRSQISNTDGSRLMQDCSLPGDQTALLDEESFTNEKNVRNSTPKRKDMWCIWCWCHFEETGHRWSPVTSVTHPSDEDESSEDDFSPFLFNT